MDLSEQISLSEIKYKSKLEDFFRKIFADTSLSSHGLDHHRRVWYYSRELLGLKDFLDPEQYESRFTEKLLFASYLHDTGMSVDPGARHGIHSRIFCEKFLLEHGLDPLKYADLLEAVEEHDRKDYKPEAGKSVLLSYLSVADDLDALGYVGIYRYLEIYLKRDIGYPVLGRIILENVKGRFDNLTETFGTFRMFTEAQRVRYEIIRSFFSNYNSEAPEYSFGNEKPTGYCGIAEITGCSVSRGMSLPELLAMAGSSGDEVIVWYFNQLKSELNSISTFT